MWHSVRGCQRVQAYSGSPHSSTQGVFCHGVGCNDWVVSLSWFFDEYFGTSIIDQFVRGHSLESYHAVIQWFSWRRCYKLYHILALNSFCQRATHKSQLMLSIRCIYTVCIPSWQWQLGACDYICIQLHSNIDCREIVPENAQCTNISVMRGA